MCCRQSNPSYMLQLPIISGSPVSLAVVEIHLTCWASWNPTVRRLKLMANKLMARSCPSVHYWQQVPTCNGGMKLDLCCSDWATVQALQSFVSSLLKCLHKLWHVVI